MEQTFNPEVVERVFVLSWKRLGFVSVKRSVCPQHKPSRSPVLYILSCQGVNIQNEGQERERGEMEGGKRNSQVYVATMQGMCRQHQHNVSVGLMCIE